jgi:hypothetical protein
MKNLDKRIIEEAFKAHEHFGPYSSTHEVAAVLKEEYEEFWDLVKRSKQDGTFKEEMIKELIQVCAVSYRTIQELDKDLIKWV